MVRLAKWVAPLKWSSAGVLVRRSGRPGALLDGNPLGGLIPHQGHHVLTTALISTIAPGAPGHLGGQKSIETLGGKRSRRFAMIAWCASGTEAAADPTL
jgi:hypothetical protein